LERPQIILIQNGKMALVLIFGTFSAFIHSLQNPDIAVL